MGKNEGHFPYFKRRIWQVSPIFSLVYEEGGLRCQSAHGPDKRFVDR